jgi:hypothetical protein
MMAEAESCKQCRYWQIMGPPAGQEAGQYRVGECARFPPQVIAIGPGPPPQMAARFPMTGEDTWCGEFKEAS